LPNAVSSFRATASGIVAPPPPSHLIEERSWRSRPGFERKSTSIVVIAVNDVTAARSIWRMAPSRSQRVSSTTVPPVWIVAFMTCMPVTWNIGRTASATVSLVSAHQCATAVLVASTERCACMQPFGFPVVPDV